MQNPISRESSLSRAREYEDAKRVAALFCDVQDPRLDRPLYAEVHSHRTYGFYVPFTTTINLTTQRFAPASTRATLEDESAWGTVAHELGHHFWYARRLSTPDARLWRTIHNAERSVSTHDRLLGSRQPHECFAEAFRLFVLNPSLLAEGWPMRYDALVGHHGARPCEQRHWREVLAETRASEESIREVEQALAY